MDDICRNYHGGHANSVAANASMAEYKQRLRERVLMYLAAHAATCDALEIILGISHQTMSARLTELKRSKQVLVVGVGRTRSGRKADIYVTANGVVHVGQ